MFDKLDFIEGKYDDSSQKGEGQNGVTGIVFRTERREFEVPTVEYDTEETMYCNHIWVYNDEERITETKDYVYLKCVNCGIQKKTIKQISFSKEECYLVEEDAP